MKEFLFWIVDFIIYTIGVGAMLLIWLSNEFVGVAPFYVLEGEPWLRALAMVGIAIVGFLFTLLLKRTIIAPLGVLTTIGAVAGVAVSTLLGLSELLEELIYDCSGFWGWVGLFFLCMIIFSLVGGAIGVSIRGLYRSLVNLDFFSALIFFMIVVSAIAGLGEIVVTLVEDAFALLVLIGIGSIGSVGGGIKADTIESFVDEDGQLIFISNSLGRDRFATTNGEIYRKMPGGYTKRHM